MVDFKILAVDDDTAALDAVVDLLRGEGYEVHAAASAEEAEDLLHRDSYHVVITDVVMPGKSGIELTRLVSDALPQSAVIVVSGRPSLRTAVSALKSGASDYLAKPLEPDKLRTLVADLVAGKPRFVPNRLIARTKESQAQAPHPKRGSVGALVELGTLPIAIGTPMREIERQVIVRTLDALQWNKNKTAQILGISRRSLYNKIERFQIARPNLLATPEPEMLLVPESTPLTAPEETLVPESLPTAESKRPEAEG